jgi:hypothetical protein
MPLDKDQIESIIKDKNIWQIILEKDKEISSIGAPKERYRNGIEYFMSEIGAVNADLTIKGIILSEVLRKFMPITFGNLAEASIGAYISDFSRAQGARINRRMEAQGYYLVDQADIVNTDKQPSEDAPLTQEESISFKKEHRLYNLLSTWLSKNRGFKHSFITADSKNGGKWGNPDLTALKTHTLSGHLNISELEILTIEVKLTEKDWKKDIFEAVAHRRFANRAYFAFSKPLEVIGKLESDRDEMQYYHELYGIGIICIAFQNTQDWKKLTTDGLAGNVLLEDVEIMDLFPAPYRAVPIRWQQGHMLNIGAKIGSYIAI